MATDNLTGGAFGAFAGGANGDVQTTALTNTTGTYATVNSVTLSVAAWTASNVDDTMGATVRIMSGATVLAGPDQLINDFTNTTSGNTNAVSMSNVLSTATSAQWDAAVIEVTQTYLASMKADGGSINSIAAITATVDYTAAAPTDALLAEDISSTSSAPSATFGQTHVIDAVDITSASTAPSATGFTQDQQLLADDISSASTAPSATFSEVAMLLADDVSSASTTDSATGYMEQQPLLADDVASASTAPSATGFTEDQQLLAEDVTSASSAPSANGYSEQFDLLADDISSASSAPSATGFSEGSTTDALLADDLLSSSSVQAGVYSETHILNAEDLSSASAVGQATLSSGSNTDTLLAEDLASASQVGAPTLVQIYSLFAEALTAATSTTTNTLSESVVHQLLAEDITTGGGGLPPGNWVDIDDPVTIAQIADEVASRFSFNAKGRVQATIKDDDSEKRLLREVKAAVPSFPNMAAVWDHAPKHLMQPMADMTPAIKALEEKLNALSTAAPSQMPALDLSPVIDALQDPARSLQPSLDALAEKVSNLAIPDHKDAIDDIRDRISDLSGALTDLELAAIGIRHRLDNLPQPDLSQVATKAEIKALESIASKLKNYDDSDIATMLQAMLADMRNSTGALSDRTGKLNQKLDLLLDNQLANF